jgi:NADH-quinone oxidoreductase subunit N
MNVELFHGSLIFTRSTWFFKLLLLGVALFMILASQDFMKRNSSRGGEYGLLLLFTILGCMLLVSARELITLFLAFELLSLPLYVLTAFNKNEPASQEAGIKYFLLGAFAAALFLYGISLIYGFAGSTFITAILAKFTQQPYFSMSFWLGAFFILAALSFKIALAPFHMWAPDVYQGAPTPVTALISTAPKIAGLALLIQLYLGCWSPYQNWWLIIFSLLSILSMLIGNLTALPQTNIKRMLAYSGIAQIGYIMIGLAVPSRDCLAAALYYLIIYSLSTLTAFGVVIALNCNAKGEELSDFEGLADHSPGLAVIMLIALLSLAGAPPLAGFLAKFSLFLAALHQGAVWLVILGILMTVISFYYYLAVLKAVYFKPAPAPDKLTVPPALNILLSLSALALLVLTFYPPLLNYLYKLAAGL